MHKSSSKWYATWQSIAQVLSSLSHEADKRLAVSLTIENTLPIHDILSVVVKRIHDEDCADDNDDNDEDMVARLTLRKIDAHQWLLYDSKQLQEMSGVLKIHIIDIEEDATEKKPLHITGDPKAVDQ